MDFKKRILLTSVISGALPSSYLVSRYSENEKLKTKGIYNTLMGITLSIFTYLFFFHFVEKLIIEPGLFKVSTLLGYSSAILLFLIIQAGCSLIFMFLVIKIYGKDLYSTQSDFSSRIDKIYFTFLLTIGVLFIIYLFSFGPFIFVFTIIYILPNIYLFKRFKQILKLKWQVIALSILYPLLILLFPLSEALSRHIELSFIRNITYIGFYSAPLLLYFFLFYLISDSLKFTLLKVKVLQKSVINKVIVNWLIFVLIFSSASIITILGAFNFINPSIQKYDIEVPGKSTSLESLKVAFAADFHFSEITSKKFVENFVSEINRMEADIVLLGGDIFESNKINKKTEYIKNRLCGIKSKYGVFAVEGNHGYYTKTNTQEFFNVSNITLLRDTVVTIDSAFTIVGRMDGHNHRNRKAVSELLSNRRNDLPIIVMNHQPNYDHNDMDGVDLYLSGHTHNGQLFPFNFIVKMVYELPWGYRKINNTHFFVTSGAQGWGPQVKTAGTSEIMEINVEFTEGNN